ncbi:Uncharacterised protein [Mycobacteroides abscessus subsp. abscessus]|nr:Uncharacterised protein [Mycobacteroides abscessus subsp. abscessus]
MDTTRIPIPAIGSQTGRVSIPTLMNISIGVKNGI